MPDVDRHLINLLDLEQVHVLVYLRTVVGPEDLQLHATPSLLQHAPEDAHRLLLVLHCRSHAVQDVGSVCLGGWRKPQLPQSIGVDEFELGYTSTDGRRHEFRQRPVVLDRVMVRVRNFRFHLLHPLFLGPKPPAPASSFPRRFRSLQAQHWRTFH
jgi:hypothetical protein